MDLKVNGKEYKVKYTYRSVIRGGLIKAVKSYSAMSSKMGESDSLGQVELALSFLPRYLLIGLQAENMQEFGCNFADEKSVSAKEDKVMDLIDAWCEENDSSPLALQDLVQEEITNEGFLKNLFQAETPTTPEEAEMKTAEETVKKIVASI